MFEKLLVPLKLNFMPQYRFKLLKSSQKKKLRLKIIPYCDIATAFTAFNSSKMFMSFQFNEPYHSDECDIISKIIPLNGMTKRIIFNSFIPYSNIFSIWKKERKEKKTARISWNKGTEKCNKNDFMRKCCWLFFRLI